MAIQEQQTLFPGDDFSARYAPIRTVAADWMNLGSNERYEILDIGGFGGQLLDINQIGGEQVDDLDIVIETERNRQRQGVVTDTATYDAEAFPGLNAPLGRGPVATDGFDWLVSTGATNPPDPYKAFLNYDIRSLTVLDKLRLGIPLQEPVETDLATRTFPGQDFTLREREDLDLPPERDPVFEPTLEDKIVLEEETVARSLDLSAAGETTVAEASVETFRGEPQDVIYLTGIAGNWQENATDTEDVTLTLENAQRQFMEIKTLGLPGLSGTVDNESFPPYYTDLHIPFLNEMTIALETSQDINNIDVQVEFVRVDRTLVEKALYGLEDEITAPDDLSPSRQRELRGQKQSIYDQLQDKLRAGLPINLERRQTREMEA